MTGGDVRVRDGVDEATQLLILSDGKPGHLNQSLAFAKLLKCDYQVRKVHFHNRLCKAISYLLDRFGIYSDLLFAIEAPVPNCRMVVSAIFFSGSVKPSVRPIWASLKPVGTSANTAWLSATASSNRAWFTIRICIISYFFW